MSVPEKRGTPSSAPSPAGTGDGASSSAGLGDGLELGTAWVQTQLTRVQTAVELSLAETRLAASSLQWMLFLAVMMAVLALTAWGILIAGTILALNTTALPLWACLVGVAAVHALIVVALFLKILSLSNNLALPVTRRHLFGDEGSAAS